MKEDGEKYGVIVCSDCKKAKIIDLTKDRKTTECHRCGQRLILKKMRIHYRTDSREEASWAIGQINARMNGEKMPEEINEEKEDLDPYQLAAKEAEHGDDERERMLIIGRVLTRDLGSFDKSDLEKVSKMTDMKVEKDMVEKFRKLDEIYEPEHGTFKSVEG